MQEAPGISYVAARQRKERSYLNSLGKNLGKRRINRKTTVTLQPPVQQIPIFDIVFSPLAAQYAGIEQKFVDLEFLGHEHGVMG